MYEYYFFQNNKTKPDYLYAVRETTLRSQPARKKKKIKQKIFLLFLLDNYGELNVFLIEEHEKWIETL